MCTSSLLLSGCDTKDEVEGEVEDIISTLNDIPNADEISIEIPPAKAISIWPRYAVGLESEQNFYADISDITPKRFMRSYDLRNITASFVTKDNVMYVLDFGVLRAINLETGETLWRRFLNKFKGTFGAITLFDKNLFVTCGKNVVASISTEDGSSLWEKELLSVARSTPLIVGDTVVIQCINNSTYGLDRETGQVRWHHTQLEDNILLMDVVAPAKGREGDVLIQYNTGQVFALNPHNGTESWDIKLTEINWDGFNVRKQVRDLPMQIIYSDEYVFACDNDGDLVAISSDRGKELWRRKIEASILPFVSGNVVYAISNNDQLLALSRDKGEMIWSIELTNLHKRFTKPPKIGGYENTEGKLVKSPWNNLLMVNDELMITSQGGVMLFIDPTDGGLIRRLYLKCTVDSKPVISNGKIFFYSNSKKGLIAL